MTRIGSKRLKARLVYVKIMWGCCIRWPEEIARCLHSLKNNKTGGSDGLVGELLNYGGSGMVDLLHQLFSVVWHEEIVPP